MITFEDCLAFCELTEDEIDAIALHEQLSGTAALEMGSFLIRDAGGDVRIQRIIIDEVSAAHRRGDLVRAAQLKQTLRRFIEQHPACKQSKEPA